MFVNNLFMDKHNICIRKLRKIYDRRSIRTILRGISYYLRKI